MNPEFRKDTFDHLIWKDVYTENEYRLPVSMPNHIVIDIGCHVGSFSAAAKIRGAKEIYAAEIDIENLSRAMVNVGRIPGNAIFQPFHAAAWRSDSRGARLVMGTTDGKNTGGAWTLPYKQDRPEVPSMPFDDIVKLATDFFRRRIDVVKFDCECAEWPILFTSKTLRMVDSICGEYHAGHFDSFGPAQNVEGVTYNLDTLRQLLQEEGFAVVIEEPNKHLYAHFWAYRYAGAFLPLN